MFTARRDATFEWIRVHTPVAGDASLENFSAQGNFSLPFDADNDVTKLSPGKELGNHYSVAQALSIVGIPDDPRLTAEEELITLLQNAAEIEHGLMLQYLYASYSASDTQIAAQLRKIAIEEMGHFISVQNLLTACGASPYLGHSDWDSKQNLFQPYPFRLEPLSNGALAKFAIGEMPGREAVPADILTDLPEIEAQADQAAGGSVEAHRVGLLYMKIYWLLRKTDVPMENPADEPWKGFPVEELAAEPKLAGKHVRDGFVSDASGSNARPEHWKGTYTSVIVKVIKDRCAALDGIAEISAQGEGFVGTADDHFERFVDAWRMAKHAASIAEPVAVNPYYGSQKPSGGGDEIISAIGVMCAQLGDGLYELVLLCTAANLLLPIEAAQAARSDAAKAALQAMRYGLGDVAKILKKLPIDETNPAGTLCGLPFSVAPINVEPTIKAVLDRADILIEDLHVAAGKIEVGSEDFDVTFMAQNVASALDDIASKLQSLRL
jgi:hypothetical protein